MSKRIWMTWEKQRRNISLSKCMGARLFQYELAGGPCKRYPLLTWRTIKIYIKEDPDVIFAQNPSIILSFLTILFGKTFSKFVVIDAHNSGIFPLKWWKRKSIIYKLIANALTSFIIKNADITIVTNENLAARVEAQGGLPYILPDPLPDFAPQLQRPVKLRGRINVLYICSYAEDEPYNEVINAGKFINEDIVIYVTGRYQGKESTIVSDIPNNVILTGYLSEDDYLAMLFQCNVIIDLTTEDDCLVCGAYEAISAEKCVILSDTAANRHYFRKGVVFSKNYAKDISRNIEYVTNNCNTLSKEVRDFKDEINGQWQLMREGLEETLGRFNVPT